MHTFVDKNINLFNIILIFIQYNLEILFNNNYR